MFIFFCFLLLYFVFGVVLAPCLSLVVWTHQTSFFSSVLRNIKGDESVIRILEPQKKKFLEIRETLKKFTTVGARKGSLSVVNMNSKMERLPLILTPPASNLLLVFCLGYVCSYYT